MWCLYSFVLLAGVANAVQVGRNATLFKSLAQLLTAGLVVVAGNALLHPDGRLPPRSSDVAHLRTGASDAVVGLVWRSHGRWHHPHQILHIGSDRCGPVSRTLRHRLCCHLDPAQSFRLGWV
jgi:hypothetical protein